MEAYTLHRTRPHQNDPPKPTQPHDNHPKKERKCPHPTAGSGPKTPVPETPHTGRAAGASSISSGTEGRIFSLDGSAAPRTRIGIARGGKSNSRHQSNSVLRGNGIVLGHGGTIYTLPAPTPTQPDLERRRRDTCMPRHSPGQRASRMSGTISGRGGMPYLTAGRGVGLSIVLGIWRVMADGRGGGRGMLFQ